MILKVFFFCCFFAGKRVNVAPENEEEIDLQPRMSFKEMLQGGADYHHVGICISARMGCCLHTLRHQELGHTCWHCRDPGQQVEAEWSKLLWHASGFSSSSLFLTRRHQPPTSVLVRGRLQPPSAVTSWISARLVLQELMPVFLTQSVF